ncbi:twitching motility protein PilT [Caballeronia mineralivorans PML1(12)]|uniref:Twitching motility protein PilT n=1 Tax=Caballeronia mineralivorans PML1(12) TaxID=908627 RepID=A0A0J1CY61_9BURK|nr:type II toxin-antitoxin system VapC family toxin [Caballeronia mineralivorans]KLU25492.1 twitching motility protein PilT [Caballeronia mineralivorans PML1(12)]
MIVLDTHTLIWWVTNDAALSKKAKTAIERERAGGEIIVSAISAWEIAMLVERETIAFSMDMENWLATVQQIPGVRFAPVDVDVSLKSVQLPGEFHKDPADRLIVATARKFAAPLVTKDLKIRAYAHVKTIW